MSDPATVPTTHPKGFWFIFWGEFAERCSYYGMKAILAVYMAEEIGLGEATASLWMSYFMAACYLLPLLGGYIADNYLGKYWTIVSFSAPYILGQVLVGVPNVNFLIPSLILLAMGTGVIKPNISTLMGLTYDQQRPGQEALRSQAFSRFYMAINIGAAIAQFFLPLVQRNFGYQAAFAVPAVFMTLALALFALGKRYYAVEPRRSAAERKAAHESTENRWKVVGHIASLFILVTFFWAIFDQSGSTWIFFAKAYMNDIPLFAVDLFGVTLDITIDPQMMQSINPVMIVCFVPVVMWVWRVLAARGIYVRATDKMILGFLLTAMSMGVMALAADRAGHATANLIQEVPDPSDPEGVKKIKTIVVNVPDAVDIPAEYVDRIKANELRVERVVAPDEKVTLGWQAICYLLITFAEILISVTGLELAFVAAPASMKSFVTALWLLSVGIANLVINAPVTQIYFKMKPAAYFLMLAVAMLVVTGIFVFVAKRFNRAMTPKSA